MLQEPRLTLISCILLCTCSNTFGLLCYRVWGSCTPLGLESTPVRLRCCCCSLSLSFFSSLPLSLHYLHCYNASRICMSSLRRGHANLLCFVPILVLSLSLSCNKSMMVVYTYIYIKSVFVTLYVCVCVCVCVCGPNRRSCHVSSPLHPRPFSTTHLQLSEDTISLKWQWYGVKSRSFPVCLLTCLSSCVCVCVCVLDKDY